MRLRTSKRQLLAITGVGLAVGLAAAVPAQAVAYTAPSVLSPTNPVAKERFGSSTGLSADGLTALVGSAGVGSSSPSSVKILTKASGSWQTQATLQASDGTANDQFGGSAALSADGSTAIVNGGPSTSVGGNVYVFKRTGSSWSQVQEITSPAPKAGGGFGGALALSNDGSAFIAGAPCNNNTTGSGCRGAAYLFGQDATGAYSMSLTFNGGSDNALLGTSVAMSSNGLVAAAGEAYLQSGTGASAPYAPSVVTFARSSNTSAWSLRKLVTAPTGSSLTDFGYSGVSLSSTGSTLLVGAPGQSYDGSTRIGGAAYTYAWGGSAWGTPAKLVHSASVTTRFGASTSLSADGLSLVIGAPQGSASSSATGGGIAFRFTRASSTAAWSFADTFRSLSTVSGDGFGSSLATPTDTSHPLLGAPLQKNTNGDEVGAAYAF